MNLLKDQPKEKVQKLILVGIVGLIVIGGIYQFYIVSQRTALREAEAKRGELQQQIEDLQRQANRAAINEGAREQITTFVDDQLATMIDGDPFTWVVRSVSLLSQNQPVKITSWHPVQKGRHSRLGEYETFTTHLEVEGRFDEIGLFLQELENRFPTGEIRSLDLTAGKDGIHRAGIDLVLLIRPRLQTEKASDPSKGA